MRYPCTALSLLGLHHRRTASTVLPQLIMYLLSVCTGTDLHDLHELRSRALVFVHDLCKKLSAVGVRAVPSRSFSLLMLCS